MNTFIGQFYQPTHNFMITGHFNGINIYSFIYGLIFILLAGLIVINILLKRPRTAHTTQRTPFFIILCVFIFVTILQTSDQILKTYAAHQYFGQTKMSERYYYKETERIKHITRVIRQYLPKQCGTQLITDRSLTQDPDLYMTRLLAYFLYPIDMRGMRDKPQDYLIVFDKQNPQDALGADFKIIRQIDQHNLITVRQ